MEEKERLTPWLLDAPPRAMPIPIPRPKPPPVLFPVTRENSPLLAAEALLFVLVLLPVVTLLFKEGAVVLEVVARESLRLFQEDDLAKGLDASEVRTLLVI